jgi:hypothetical protein
MEYDNGHTDERRIIIHQVVRSNKIKFFNSGIQRIGNWKAFYHKDLHHDLVDYLDSKVLLEVVRVVE